MVDATGSIHTLRTDEFGIPQAGQGSSGQPFGYTGEQKDGETGLVYLRARLYDPQLGRFVQRDPVGGQGYRPLSLNRYSYVENNPVNATDPSGLVSRAKSGGLCIPLPGWPCPQPWPMPAPTPAPTPGPTAKDLGLQPLPKRKEVQAPACPGPSSTFYDEQIDNRRVLGRGPEGGPMACHVNIDVQDGINLHIYWEDTQYIARAGGVFRQLWGLALTSSASSSADIVIDYIANQFFASEIGRGRLWGELLVPLTNALYTLRQLQTGALPT